MMVNVKMSVKLWLSFYLVV